MAGMAWWKLGQGIDYAEACSCSFLEKYMVAVQRLFILIIIGVLSLAGMPSVAMAQANNYAPPLSFSNAELRGRDFQRTGKLAGRRIFQRQSIRSQLSPEPMPEAQF
jgi:hypothetical protein